MDKQINKKYRQRILREAILKSLLIGLTAGCICAAVTELLSWFFGFMEGLYIAIGLLVVVTAVVTTIVYFTKYKLTTRAVARRIDELGLEERVLTMVEYRDDDSFMATAQRKDTERALSKVNHTLIKFAVTMAMIVAISVSAFVLAGTTTVNALYVGNVIPSGLDLIKGEPKPVQYTVRYTATEGGQVMFYTDEWGNVEVCKEELVVEEGGNAPMVIAVANPGYVFIGWSDNESNLPNRMDVSIGGNIKATARFEKLLDPTLDDGSIYSPSLYMPGVSENGGESNGDHNPDAPPIPSDEAGGGDTSDRNSSNMTDNGQNYYGDSYGEDFGNAMGQGGSNSGLVDGYFSGMTPPGAGSGEGGNG